MDMRFEQTNRLIDDMNRLMDMRIEQVNRRIDELTLQMNIRFEQMEDRIERVDKRISREFPERMVKKVRKSGVRYLPWSLRKGIVSPTKGNRKSNER